MSTVGLDSVLSTQSSFGAQSSTDKADSLGKDDFLNLLVAQLQYQDPLNPVENTDFTAQLAQFTSLETLSSIDDNIAGLGVLQSSINNISAVSFIGKQVNAEGNVVNFTGDEVSLDFELDAQASDVVVGIYDGEGRLVRTMTRQNVPAGDVQCTWDGTDDSGEAVSEGRYRFLIEARDYEGEAVGTASYASGTVTGVRYDGNTTYLVIGDREVDITDIKKIQG